MEKDKLLKRPKKAKVFASKPVDMKYMPVEFGTNTVVGQNVEKIANSNFEYGLESLEGDFQPRDLNAVLNYVTNNIGYIFQQGIPEFSEYQNYPVGSVVQYDGKLWLNIKALEASKETKEGVSTCCGTNCCSHGSESVLEGDIKYPDTDQEHWVEVITRNSMETAKPEITIDPVKGTWIIDGVDTGKPSRGVSGRNGVDGLNGAKGDKGDRGERGLQGLKGDKGDTGKSAYDIWLEAGNVGTKNTFLNSLKGEQTNKQEYFEYIGLVENICNLASHPKINLNSQNVVEKFITFYSTEDTYTSEQIGYPSKEQTGATTNINWKGWAILSRSSVSFYLQGVPATPFNTGNKSWIFTANLSRSAFKNGECPVWLPAKSMNNSVDLNTILPTKSKTFSLTDKVLGKDKNGDLTWITLDELKEKKEEFLSLRSEAESIDGISVNELSGNLTQGEHTVVFKITNNFATAVTDLRLVIDTNEPIGAQTTVSTAMTSDNPSINITNVLSGKAGEFAIDTLPSGETRFTTRITVNTPVGNRHRVSLRMPSYNRGSLPIEWEDKDPKVTATNLGYTFNIIARN